MIIKYLSTLAGTAAATMPVSFPQADTVAGSFRHNGFWILLLKRSSTTAERARI